MDVIVPSYAVALFGAAVGVVQVVLDDVGIGVRVVHVAFGTAVDVAPEFTAEKVFYRGIVGCAGVVQVYPSL